MTTALTTALAKSLAKSLNVQHRFQQAALTGVQYEATLSKLGINDAGMSLLAEIDGFPPTFIGLYPDPAAKPEHIQADIATIECVGALLGRKKSAKVLITLRATKRAAQVQPITQRERNPFCPDNVNHYGYIEEVSAL